MDARRGGEDGAFFAGEDAFAGWACDMGKMLVPTRSRRPRPPILEGLARLAGGGPSSSSSSDSVLSDLGTGRADFAGGSLDFKCGGVG